MQQLQLFAIERGLYQKGVQREGSHALYVKKKQSRVETVEGYMYLTVTFFVHVCICGLCLDEKEIS